jgi:hypothetical protein
MWPRIRASVSALWSTVKQLLIAQLLGVRLFSGTLDGRIPITVRQMKTDKEDG